MQEAARQQALADAQDKLAIAEKARAVAEFRKDCRAKYSAMKKQAGDLDTLVRTQHAASQRKQRQMEAADVRVETTLAQRAAARKELARLSVAKQVQSSIETFEVQLARTADSGVAGSGERAGGDSIKASLSEQGRLEQQAKV